MNSIRLIKELINYVYLTLEIHTYIYIAIEEEEEEEEGEEKWRIQFKNFLSSDILDIFYKDNNNKIRVILVR